MGFGVLVRTPLASDSEPLHSLIPDRDAGGALNLRRNVVAIGLGKAATWLAI